MTQSAAASDARPVEHYDILVMGAGPAGAAAALTAARHGMSVALIDRRRFPRDKLCGGGITGRCAAALERLLGHPLPGHLAEERGTFEFHAHGASLGTVDGVPPIHLTTRRAFDTYLQSKAIAAGADDRSGQKPAGIDPGKCRVTLDSGATLEGRILIGADGVASTTARSLFGRAYDPHQVGFAMEVEASPEQDTPDRVRIDFGAAEWGYGWHFPKSGSATIGVGGLHGRNPEMRAALETYLRGLGVDPSMQKVKGAFLPFGAFRRIPGRGRVLLAGDAAGLVDPITGEGLAHAIDSGRMAAEAATAALAEDRPETALPLYRKSLGPIHGALRHARALRLVIYAPPLKAGFIRAFRDSRTLRHDYLRMLGGQREYADIMAALLRRLPRHLSRSLLVPDRAH